MSGPIPGSAEGVDLSIVIPVHDRAHCLGRAIAGILSQPELAGPPGGTTLSWELLVVDDASRDDSAGVAEGFGDPRIRVLRHPINRGAAAARNTGVAAARGRFVAFLDSDDEWLPGKLAAQWAAMTAPDAPDVTCTAFTLRHADTGAAAERRPTAGNGVAGFLDGCFVAPGSTMMARRECLIAVGPFDESLPRLEDWDWFLRMAEHHRCEVIAAPTCVVHVGGFPALAPVREAVARLRGTHRERILRTTGGKGWRRFRATLEIELCVAALRNRHPAIAIGHLLRASLLSPPRVRAFLGRIGGRVRRPSPPARPIPTKNALPLLAAGLAAALCPGDLRAGNDLLPETVGATIVVAPHDAPEALRARADLVASGNHDEIVLARSLALARRYPVDIDTSPVEQRRVEVYGRFRALWLPGSYVLDGPLTIPDTADAVIEAEGAVMEYRPATGDAVVVEGGYRSRYRLGTIVSGGDGAALRIAPTPTMPFLMSEIGFTGLVGRNGRGVGLLIDPSGENVTTSRFQGTDVGGFDTCVQVRPPHPPPGSPPGFGKMDTNHFWLSYLRRCRLAIDVDGAGGRVDSNVWDVNVDASLPGSTAIRTSGRYDRWKVIMGTWADDGVALVLAPGARGNVFDVTPPLETFGFRDDSGNRSNVMVGAGNLAALPTLQPSPPPPKLVELIEPDVGPDRDYNLLRIDDRFVALHQGLGAVDPRQEVLGERELPPWIFLGADDRDLRRRLVAAGEDPAAFTFHRFRGATIAARGELPAAAMGHERLGVRSLPPLIVTGPTVEAVKRKLAPDAPPTDPPIR